MFKIILNKLRLVNLIREIERVDNMLEEVNDYVFNESKKQYWGSIEKSNWEH